MESYFHPVVAAGHVYTASIPEPNRLSSEELFLKALSPETRVLEQVKLS